MKRHKKSAVFILVVITGIIAAWRFVSLNAAYPDPAIITYREGEAIKGGDIEISVLESRLVPMEQFMESTDGLKSEIEDMEGSTLTGREGKVLLVKLNIRNTSASEKKTSLVRFTAQSGAWANGMDFASYCAVNNTEETNIILEGYEQRDMTMPFYLYKFQFTGDEFDRVDERAFSLVLSTYPVKNIVELDIN